MLIMHGFTGILFQMQTLNANFMAAAICQIDHQAAFAHNWLLELADLITLWQIGIKVIFAIKHTCQINLCLQAQPCLNGLAHTHLINHRQHARHRGIHQRHILVWICPKAGRGARK